MPRTSKFEVAGDAGHAEGSGFQQIEEDKLLKPIRVDCGVPLGKTLALSCHARLGNPHQNSRLARTTAERREHGLAGPRAALTSFSAARSAGAGLPR